MTKKKESGDLRKKIIDAYEENEYASLLSNRNRARSLSVGTAFGGIIEVSMRGDFHSLWCTLQPVEAVELIEQIAASAGLEIAIRPRQDFATWRGWDTDADHKYWAGAAHWQVKQIKQAEEEKEKSLQLSAGSESDYRKELNDEVNQTIKNAFDQANDEIERIREELKVENAEAVDRVQSLEEFQEEGDSNNYYKIREKIAKDDLE